jgi:hypothetical protein
LNLLFQSDYCDIGSTYLQYFLTEESLGRRLIKPVFLNNTSNSTNCETNDILLIMRIKIFYFARAQCFTSFCPTEDVIKRFNADIQVSQNWLPRENRHVPTTKETPN